MKRIAFIEPPVSLEDIYGAMSKTGSVAPPLNLLLLAAIVRKRGYDPVIIDCPAEGLTYTATVDMVKRIAPRYVGITAMTPHIVQAAKLAALIKSAVPETVIILGGVHVTAAPIETLSRYASFDMAAVGEADDSLPELLDALEDGRPTDSVAGLVIRKNGVVRSTGSRTEKVKVDALPMYAWDLLKGFPSDYKPPLFASHRTPATPIITSRGCPGTCTFCFSGCHATVATYSAGYIFDMLLHLKSSYGIKEFMIYDDNFVMYRKNMHELLGLMISEKLGLTWSCNARVDMVTGEMLRQMAEAGCWQVSFGIETGNEKIMSSLNKKITKRQVEQAVMWSKEAGIRTVGYFMIGHFGETDRTAKETVDFAIALGLDDFRLSFFTPLPGTRSYLLANEYGEFEDDWGKMTLFSPVFVPKGFTKESLVAAQKKALGKFFLRPRTIFSYMKMVRKPHVFVRGAIAFGRYLLAR